MSTKTFQQHSIHVIEKQWTENCTLPVFLSCIFWQKIPSCFSYLQIVRITLIILFYEYCLQVVHVHSNSIMTMWPEKVTLICKQHKFGLNQTLNTKLSMRTWESCWYKTIHKFKHTWYSMNYAHRLRNYDANMLLVKYLFKWFDQ